MARVITMHTDEARREAANHYAVTGSLKATSKATNIPETTLCDWSKGRGDPNGVFVPHVESCRTEITSEFVGKFEAICNKALNRLSERLDDDPESVTGSQLAVISGIAIDKAQLLAGKPTSRSASVGMTELAAQFRRLSQGANQQPASTQAIEDKSVGAEDS